MKILVTGGTGTVGSKVIDELQKRGANVRALVRKQDASKQGVRMPAGVELFVGDLLDPISVQNALQGVEKLYLLNAVVADELTQALIPYDLAKRMKLQQIVYLSVFKAQAFKDVPHFASKLAVESAFHEFDLPSTIIRPNVFFPKRPRVEGSDYEGRHIPVAALTSDGHLARPTTWSAPTF